MSQGTTGLPTGDRARLQSHFSTVSAKEQGPKWDDLWKDNFLPWDRGTPNPALVDLLESGKIPLPKPGQKRPKAFVPGCGKGYDTLLLSAFGFDAYGLDISPIGIHQAKELTSDPETSALPVYATRNEKVGRGVVKFVLGDFFKDEFKGEVEVKEGEEWNGKFDVLYDYTFGCALPPSLRPQWSIRYQQLLSPTGSLICLEFPTTKPEGSGGPPWHFSSKVHMAHLTRPGENLEYAYDKDLVKDSKPLEERWGLLENKLKEAEVGKGLGRVEYFKPARTHPIGTNENGEVMDMVSVWKHAS